MQYFLLIVFASLKAIMLFSFCQQKALNIVALLTLTIKDVMNGRKLVTFRVKQVMNYLNNQKFKGNKTGII